MDGAEHRGSVEAEVWELFDADDDAAEETLYLVAAALHSDEELAEQLGTDAPAPRRPASEPPPPPPPLRAFLRSITVAGFRGIGPEAVLEVNPYCGLTVVSGRNGCGKSTFAEALEYALTGNSYRWAKKNGQQWETSWRNLHAGEPASITAEFAMEPDDHRDGSTTYVKADWKPGAGLHHGDRWSQVRGRPKESVDALGWDQDLITHRPIMSYDEIGGLLEDSPKSLYHALNLLLGLDDLDEADTRLSQFEKRLGGRRKAADGQRAELRKALAAATDPRAAEVTKLTARKPYDLDSISSKAIGAATDQAATIARLRQMASAEVTELSAASAAATELRAAIDAYTAVADTVTDTMAQRASLLRDALEFHQHAGDGPCPVCEAGTLDPAWRAAVQSRLREAEQSTESLQAAKQRLKQARHAAEGVFRSLAKITPATVVDIAELHTFNEAVTHAQNVPDSLADQPAHVELSATRLIDAAQLLRTAAAARAKELEDAWTPLAQAIAAWVKLESDARIDDDQLDRVTAALKWIRSAGSTLRDRRLGPVIAQASAIWSRMKHESNVELGRITLKGAAHKRQALIEGSVDGVSVGALSVMSQGELHALALALFIPRATADASPFRFLVLDDPIQAMDPAKIGGFLDVLVELSKTRQIIVFSHDDRLPAAIRARSIEAQLLVVTREENSVVVVRENDIPAHRYISDVAAVILDENLDDIVKRRAAPGLFRMAVEAAAHQRFFTRRAGTGAVYHETDTEWDNAKRTRQRVTLAVTGTADGDLSTWIRLPHRAATLRICGSGTHNGAPLDRESIRDLRKTVGDIVENR